MLVKTYKDLVVSVWCRQIVLDYINLERVTKIFIFLQAILLYTLALFSKYL